MKSRRDITYSGGVLSRGPGGRHGGRQSDVASTIPPPTSNAQWPDS